MAEWSQMEEVKKAQLLDGVDRLVAAIAEQRIFEDQVEPLREMFEMWRMYFAYFKNEYPYEYQSWLRRWPNVPLD
jgi:hypothetical protein